MVLKKDWYKVFDRGRGKIYYNNWKIEEVVPLSRNEEYSNISKSGIKREILSLCKDVLDVHGYFEIVKDGSVRRKGLITEKGGLVVDYVKIKKLKNAHLDQKDVVVTGGTCLFGGNRFV